MKIDKNTWHYKLWRKSFILSRDVPDETDLCRYCHKVFWQLMGIAAMAGMFVMAIGCVLGLVGIFLYRGLWLNTEITLRVIGVIAPIVLLVYLYHRWLNGKRRPSSNNTGLVKSWMTARKQSVCPLVEFSDDNATEDDEDNNW